MPALISVVLVAFALAMDALAASVSIGICIPRVRFRHALKVGLIFGSFQAAMPAAGWYLGRAFRDVIQPLDHWLAFVLLAAIGGHMIRDAVINKAADDDPDYCPIGDPLDTRRLLGLGVATSIDALAAGISLSIEAVSLTLSVLVIGVVTFLICVIGVLFSRGLGRRFRRRACMIGGSVLILIGVKIVIEHLIAGI
jgi:putative Mn2+ efflux pump MntP